MDENIDVWRKLGSCTEVIDMASTPARLYILVAYLQFALRNVPPTHPSALIARDILENMTEAICHHVPEMRETIELGWNPAYDVTQSYFDAEFTND